MFWCHPQPELKKALDLSLAQFNIFTKLPHCFVLFDTFQCFFQRGWNQICKIQIFICPPVQSFNLALVIFLHLQFRINSVEVI